MKVRLLTAAAVAALIAGPVSAQTMSNSGSMTAQGTMSTQGAMSSQDANLQRCTAGGAMGASMSGNAAAGGSMGSSMSGAANAGGAIGASMSMNSNGTMSCMSDMGRVVVSNAPIPDSPSTRARTGGPDSMGGKMTAPRPGPVQKSTRGASRRR